jgi:anti-sigma B factor antagonist
MALTVEQVGEVTVVTVPLDQFDASNADEFRREIDPVLHQTHKLVLDMSPVQFVDSRACGAILSCLKALTEAKGDLKICQVVRFVRTVFEMIRLHRICEICDTREQAIQAFQKT